MLIKTKLLLIVVCSISLFIASGVTFFFDSKAAEIVSLALFISACVLQERFFSLRRKVSSAKTPSDLSGGLGESEKAD
jgi:hypothetical protein